MKKKFLVDISSGEILGCFSAGTSLGKAIRLADLKEDDEFPVHYEPDGEEHYTRNLVMMEKNFYYRSRIVFAAIENGFSVGDGVQTISAVDAAYSGPDTVEITLEIEAEQGQRIEIITYGIYAGPQLETDMAVSREADEWTKSFNRMMMARREETMATSTEKKNKWNREHYSRIVIEAPHDWKARAKEAAEDAGESLSAYLMRATEYRMANGSSIDFKRAANG